MILSLSFIVRALDPEYSSHFCFVVSSSIASVRFLSLRSLSTALAFRVSVHLGSLRVCRVLLVHCVRRLALRCHVDCLLAPKYCARFAAHTSDPFSLRHGYGLCVHAVVSWPLFAFCLSVRLRFGFVCKKA